jgi:UDP-GlcNAc:undecaprenyl-phosphate GlcNAc-1-phosphate transferase
MVLFGFTAGLIGGLILTPIVRALARRFGVVDHPDGGRKTHPVATPLMGGMAVFFAIVIAGWLLRDHLLGGFLNLKQLIGLLAGAGVLILGGVLDDRYDLKPKQQLCFTALAALIIIAAGIGADVITNPFGGVLRLDRWHLKLFEAGGVPYRLTLPADLFTFAWLMVMMYTTKFLDGLDGLVSGLGIVGAVVLAIFSLTPEVGQPELARLSMIVAGAFAGFLFFNARPASIFLGEGGATLCGFLLGVMAILSGGKIGTTLMVLAVPLLDLAWTVVRRLLDRKPLAMGDAGHLHFRLISLGFSHGQTVALFWSFAAAFGGAGLFWRGGGKGWALLIVAAAFVVFSVFMRKWPGKGNPHGRA